MPEHKVVLTPHARDRCAEMDVRTKVVKRIAREREVAWPCLQADHPPGRSFVRSPAVDDRLLLVIGRGEELDVVITVLWWEPDCWTDFRVRTVS